MEICENSSISHYGVCSGDKYSKAQHRLLKVFEEISVIATVDYVVIK